MGLSVYPLSMSERARLVRATSLALSFVNQLWDVMRWRRRRTGIGRDGARLPRSRGGRGWHCWQADGDGRCFDEEDDDVKNFKVGAE